MKNPILLLTLFLILLTAACQKEEASTPVIVGGYAINHATGDTLAGVKVRLRRDDLSPGSSSKLRGFETLVDSVLTDQNGYFEFRLPNNKEIYGFEPKEEGYYYNPGMYVFPVGNRNYSGYVNFFPLTYLKVRLINKAPSQPTDSLWYDGPTDSSWDFVENYQNWNLYSHDFSLLGTNIDTTIFITLRYDEAPLQFWDITENGLTTRSFAYQGCSPHDTCNFLIEY
jgi:hypothetical protein